MGMALQLGFLPQSFWAQAAAPWPLKVPEPDIVRWSMCSMVSQESPLIMPSWAGAFNVPSSWISTGALQGPSIFTSFNGNVPFGIRPLPALVAAHASFQALNRALKKNSKKKKKQELFQQTVFGFCFYFSENANLFDELFFEGKKNLKSIYYIGNTKKCFLIF